MNSQSQICSGHIFIRFGENYMSSFFCLYLWACYPIGKGGVCKSSVRRGACMQEREGMHWRLFRHACNRVAEWHERPLLILVSSFFPWVVLLLSFFKIWYRDVFVEDCGQFLLHTPVMWCASLEVAFITSPQTEEDMRTIFKFRLRYLDFIPARVVKEVEVKKS